MFFLWKLNILASKKSSNQFPDPTWGGESSKSIREGENPEKIQKNVKIKSHSLKKAKIEKLKTWRCAQQQYLKHHGEFFPLYCTNKAWFFFDINFCTGPIEKRLRTQGVNYRKFWEILLRNWFCIGIMKYDFPMAYSERKSCGSLSCDNFHFQHLCPKNVPLISDLVIGTQAHRDTHTGTWITQWSFWRSTSIVACC